MIIAIARNVWIGLMSVAVVGKVTAATANIVGWSIFSISFIFTLPFALIDKLT